MKKLAYILLSIISIQAFYPLDADALVLLIKPNYNKIEDFSFKSYSGVAILDCDRELSISMRQIDTSDENSLEFNDIMAFYIGRNTFIEYKKDALYPWPNTQDLKHFILGPLATQLPLVRNYDPYSEEITPMFAQKGRKIPEIKLEIQSEKLINLYNDSINPYRPADESFSIDTLLIAETCKELPGSYFSTPDLIICKGLRPPVLSTPFPDEVYENVKLIVPDRCIAYYQKDEMWNKFRTITDPSGNTSGVKDDFAQRPDKWWENIPEEELWTVKCQDAWTNYDYVYVDSSTQRLMRIYPEPSNHEFKNTVFTLNGKIYSETRMYDVSFPQQYSCWPFPIPGFKNVKDLVIEENGDLSYCGYGVLNPHSHWKEEYTCFFPIELYPENDYTLWVYKTKLEYPYENALQNTEDSWVWQTYIKKLVVCPENTLISLHKLTGLEEIISLPLIPPTIHTNFTDDQYNNTLVYVPVGAYYKYRSDRIWGKFKNLIEKSYDPSDVKLPQEKAALQMRIENGELVCVGELDEDLSVYTADGRTIYRGRDTRISVPKGVIIVRCGNRTRKLVN